MLIREYCADNFGYFNLVDTYYRSYAENAILMFLVILTIYPLLFMCIALIADKYLSEGMRDLAKRLALSPTLAAVTLIAFANGAPDVLASLSSSGKDNGAYISLGALFGAFIFSTTLVISNVVHNAKDSIQLPSLAVKKELGFYLISVVVVCIFGLFKKSGWPFVAVYLILYVTYIVVTLLLERLNKPVEGEKKDEEVGGDQGKGPEKLPEEGDGQEKPKTLLKKMMDDVIDEEGSFTQNLVGVPLKILGMITVSYLENPLVETPLKYLIIAISTYFTITILELSSAAWYIIAIIGGFVGLIVLAIDLLKLSENASQIITEMISVFAAIGWIKIFSTIVIDFISFLAFYFNINEVILSSILLSAGNTVGDFFGNGALSANGEEVMGAMASYSGQIFNNFVGFSANMMTGAANGRNSFDIFALDYYNGMERDEYRPPPVGNYFLIAVICFVFFIIVLKFIVYASTSYILKKPLVKVLIPTYAVFFVSSMCFGFVKF